MKYFSKKHRRKLFFSVQHHRPNFSFSSISRLFHFKAFISATFFCIFLLLNIYSLLSEQYIFSIVSVFVLAYAFYKLPKKKEEEHSPDDKNDKDNPDEIKN